jgi:hypothetical protein
VVLSFLKASYHVFEEAGIPKREGFDLFKPDQLICLTMGSMNVVKFGTSVSLKRSYCEPVRVPLPLIR